MALSNLAEWNGESNSKAVSACGSGDKPAACGSGDKPAACGSGDKPSACGSACGAGDK